MAARARHVGRLIDHIGMVVRDFPASEAFNDKVNADPALVQIRADALRDAQGSTLEIGFGSGLNLEHYPAAVSKLLAIEPNPGMLERASASAACRFRWR